MKLRVATIRNVPVYFHYTWLFLLGMFMYRAIYENHGPQYAALPTIYKSLVGGLVGIGLTLSIILHEFGHVIKAQRYRVPVKDIVIFMLGGAATIKDEPKRPGELWFIASGGPLVSIILAEICRIVLKLWTPPLLLKVTLEELFIINIAVTIFNLIPVYPLDGGRLLHSVIWRISGCQYSSLVITTWITVILGTALVILSAFGGLWMVMVIMMLVVLSALGAKKEASLRLGISVNIDRLYSILARTFGNDPVADEIVAEITKQKRILSAPFGQILQAIEKEKVGG